jgi:ferredoxin
MHFAVVPRERWHAGMVPVAEWLAREPQAREGLVPYVWAVDRANALVRVIADQRLMNAAFRCRTLWHRLQEQGGIHNSHAERLLARERAAWEASARDAAPVADTTAATPAPAPAATAPEPVPDRSPDEAWIETSRCPSCNECQLINDRMFRYNENKQAYIGDLKAGTYRQLVEAAEACQVAIIHPGKPINPDEPGLPELLERARPFQ